MMTTTQQVFLAAKLKSGGGGETGIDTSDATATAADILKGKTAYAKSVKLTGTVESKESATYIPTTEDLSISAGVYLAGDQTIKGDANLAPGSIKKGVSIFGVIGTYDAGGTINEFYLLDTNDSTSKNDTLTICGESVYIYESTDSSVSSLSDVVAKWGGVDVQNNYIGDSSSLYGVFLSNYSQSNCNTGILFASPLDLTAGKVLVTINAYINSWMNQTLNLRLVAADDLEAAKAKILASDFDYTSIFVFAGNTSLRDHIISMGTVEAGKYYLYIDGTVTADNSGFTYNRIELLNY